MSAQEFLESIAADLKKRKELDDEVAKQVVEMLVLVDNPLEGANSLELALYKIAMRRAGGK